MGVPLCYSKQYYHDSILILIPHKYRSSPILHPPPRSTPRVLHPFSPSQLPKILRAVKFDSAAAFPRDYEADFQRALLTFRHQVRAI